MTERSSRLKGLRLSNEETNRLTRESLETALLQLLQEQDIRDISIEALVQRAGVSRMAYYRNFGSKEAILDNCITRVCDKIAAVMGPYLRRDDWPGARREIFRVLYEYKDFCRVLIAAHESERLQNFFNAFAAECAYDDSDRELYQMYFWAGAAYNLMYIWLREGSPSRRTRWLITATRPVCRARKPDAGDRRTQAVPQSAAPQPPKRGSTPSSAEITCHRPRKTISSCGRKSHQPRKNTPCAVHRGCSLWFGFPSALRA